MREKLAAVSQTAGAVVYSLALAVHWAHATFVAPVGSFLADGLLPIYEESVKAFVREWFAVLSRNINSASAFLLSLLWGRSYRRTAARNAAQKQQAWHRWWRSAKGTFNALIEQEGLTGAARSNGDSSRLGASGSGPSGLAAAAPLPLPSLSGGLRWGDSRSGSGLSSSGSGRVEGGLGDSTGSAARKGSRWRFWRRRGAGSGAEGAADDGQPATPTGLSELRRGSALFELPSGFAVSQMVSSRGLLEDLEVGTEVAVGRAFGAVRRFLHRLLMLDPSGSPDGGSDRDSPADLLERRMRRVAPPPMPAVDEEGQAAAVAAAGGGTARTAAQPAMPPAMRRGGSVRRPPLKSLLRSGRHWEEDLSVWTASDVILREGYPLEQHTVTTADGYVLQMHRIPRHGARDVAFFQHGVLDTSLGWVSNGVVGSAAFAAFDAGFDVWLGNSRSNAPRLHVEADHQGSRYWHYSLNEMAVYDISADITHIHNTKMAELATSGHHAAASHEPSMQAGPQLRRAATDSVLDALRWVDVHSDGSRGELERGAGALAGKAAAAAGQEEDREKGEVAAAGERRQTRGGETAAAAAAAGSEGTSGQQKQQQAQQQQYWWQRLTERRGRQAQAEIAMAPVGRGAAPLRRCQSASEPLQRSTGQGPSQVAVPISTRSMQRQAGSGTNSKGSGSGGGGSSGGGKAGGTCGTAQEVLPYRLQAVGHSLGAATLLMYAVVCRMRGQPHRLRRMVLMSPAGFHPRMPLGLSWCAWVFPALAWMVDRIPGLRGRGMGLRLPSPLLRYIAFKFTMDLRHMPALDDLVKAGMRMMLSGDSSQWDAALKMPHYSTYSMPALSLHSGSHCGQWAQDLSFRMYDYGTAAANRQHYGTDKPPSIADNYHLLDVPVDLVAGAADGIIPPACVVMHAQHLRSAGVPCSFRILPYGHMDFTFAVKEDIRLFVLSKLRNPL